MNSVVKPWVSTLSFRMQGTLLSALRGCDGLSKNDPSKSLTRALRQLLLHPADPGWAMDPNNTFFRGALTEENVNEFLADVDRYPVHWLMHFAHAAAIVGYFYEDTLGFGRDVRIPWRTLYHRICEALHLHPETSDQLSFRLRDGRRSPEEESVARARI